MSVTATSFMRYNKDDEDDMSLADIISLKISTSNTAPTSPAPSTPIIEEKHLDTTSNMMWRDWTMQQQQQHNEMYQKQLQSSYYQLQYLQQQQMLMMLNSGNSSRRSSTISSAASTTSTISSSNRHYRPHIPQYYQLSPSSSTSSSVKHYPSNKNSSKSRTNRASINSTTSTINSTKSAISVETLPKRRQSLGKRIKKVFGMTETTTRPTLLSVEVPADKTIAPASTKISPSTTFSNSSSLKNKGMFMVNTMPDSPTSSISSRHTSPRRRFHDSLNSLPPSPASSTVSTTSIKTNHTNSSSTTITTASTAPTTLSDTTTTTTSTTNTTSVKKKKMLAFNSVIKVHETFSPSEYDRRCDTGATCQKLTPVLALKIKEELNHFKLNEMFVHVDSRQNTHFFM